MRNAKTIAVPSATSVLSACIFVFSQVIGCLVGSFLICAGYNMMTMHYPKHNWQYPQDHKRCKPLLGEVQEEGSVDGDHTYAGVSDDLAQLEPRLRDGGVIFADDCMEGNYFSPWGAKARNFSQGAMFDAYAEYVASRPASLSAVVRVASERRCRCRENCGLAFCVGAKGRTHHSVRNRLAQFAAAGA